MKNNDGLQVKKVRAGCLLTFLASACANVQAPLSIEERLAHLEQRLKETEQRAVRAETEIRALKRQDNPVTVASATPTEPALRLNDYGELKFYGDVEFNMDGAK